VESNPAARNDRPKEPDLVCFSNLSPWEKVAIETMRSIKYGTFRITFQNGQPETMFSETSQKFGKLTP
jgi:hypothetical protein